MGLLQSLRLSKYSWAVHDRSGSMVRCHQVGMSETGTEHTCGAGWRRVGAVGHATWGSGRARPRPILRRRFHFLCFPHFHFSSSCPAPRPAPRPAAMLCSAPPLHVLSNHLTTTVSFSLIDPSASSLETKLKTTHQARHLPAPASQPA